MADLTPAWQFEEEAAKVGPCCIFVAIEVGAENSQRLARAALEAVAEVEEQRRFAGKAVFLLCPGAAVELAEV